VIFDVANKVLDIVVVEVVGGYCYGCICVGFYDWNYYIFVVVLCVFVVGFVVWFDTFGATVVLVV